MPVARSRPQRSAERTAAPGRRAEGREIGLSTKRAQDPPDPDDGYRVLVDRLWPRGLRKEDLHLDDWVKDLAPSDALRRFFGHDPARWDEFARRYREELQTDEAQALIRDLAARAARGRVTLVYAAHDRSHNNAIVLLQEILARLGTV